MRVSLIAWIVLSLSFVATLIYWRANPDEDIGIYLAIFEVVIGLIAFGLDIFGKPVAESSLKPTYDQQLRRALIENVRRTWIDGVLKDALRDAQFDIALKTAPKQARESAGYTAYKIPQPKTPQQRAGGLMQLIRVAFRREQQPDEIIPNTPETIVRVFHDNGGKLLILGEPGSGKSVLLLQLAEKLLDEAEQRNSWPLPIVLNLSVWAVARKPISEWIIEELQRPAYGLRKKRVAELVENKRLIFLLDGLDEVAEAYRLECLEKVNTFMAAGHKVALCSRTAEYEALKAKLATHNAIEMQPLTPAEAESYLNRHIPAETVTAILNMLKTDDVVWKEARKPVFLNILIATYHDRDAVSVTTHFRPADPTIQQVQRLIIEPYIERQLQAVPVNSTVHPYPRDKTRHYLAWLGWHMRNRGQTTFYVEELQRDWLPRYKWVYDALRFVVPVLGIGLFFGIVFGLSNGLVFGLLGGVVFGIGGGLAVAQIIGSGTVDLNKKTNWKPDFRQVFWIAWTVMIDEVRSSFRTGLKLIIVSVLSIGISFIILIKSLLGLVAGLVIGLIIGLILYFIRVLFTGIIAAQIGALHDVSLPIQRSRVNQGFSDTLVNGLVFWMTSGLVIGLIAGSSFGLSFGLGSGLSMGLRDIFKHTILRVLLHWVAAAPRRFDHFFTYVKDLRLMRQVGGGMIFIHRYVLEYFADQYTPAGD